MNPSDANSPLATLRQLKEMLDAGALTPQEFEALKQQLVFGGSAPAAPAASSPPVASTTAPPMPPAAEAAPSAGSVPSPTPAASTANEAADWLATPAPLPVPAPLAPEYTTPGYAAEAEERRSPLTLVFAIGGALVLLGIVLYLFIGRPAPDEHLTSGSQTAADSAAIAPEVGPQAAQLPLTTVAPETIRVAPPTPPPVASGVATKLRADSVILSKPAKAVKAIVPATPPAAPAPSAPADSAATKAGQQ